MEGTMKSTEKFRHECEIRYLLRLRTTDADAAHLYITKVQKKRGETAATKLLEDSRRQWKWGGRGKQGQWLLTATIESDDEY